MRLTDWNIETTSPAQKIGHLGDGGDDGAVSPDNTKGDRSGLCRIKTRSSLKCGHPGDRNDGVGEYRVMTRQEEWIEN